MQCFLVKINLTLDLVTTGVLYGRNQDMYLRKFREEQDNGLVEVFSSLGTSTLTFISNKIHSTYFTTFLIIIKNLQKCTLNYALFNKNKLILQQDNAPMHHVFKSSKEQFTNENIKLLPCPAKHPDVLCHFIMNRLRKGFETFSILHSHS